MAHVKDGRPTLKLLDDVEAEILRLRKKTKQLASDLAKAKRRIAALEKRSISGRKPPAVPVVEPVKTLKPPKRQALGRGLAQIRQATLKP